MLVIRDTPVILSDFSTSFSGQNLDWSEVGKKIAQPRNNKNVFTPSAAFAIKSYFCNMFSSPFIMYTWGHIRKKQHLNMI